MTFIPSLYSFLWRSMPYLAITGTAISHGKRIHVINIMAAYYLWLAMASRARL